MFVSNWKSLNFEHAATNSFIAWNNTSIVARLDNCCNQPRVENYFAAVLVEAIFCCWSFPDRSERSFVLSWIGHSLLLYGRLSASVDLQFPAEFLSQKVFTIQLLPARLKIWFFAWWVWWHGFAIVFNRPSATSEASTLPWFSFDLLICGYVDFDFLASLEASQTNSMWNLNWT